VHQRETDERAAVHRFAMGPCGNPGRHRRGKAGELGFIFGTGDGR
jgi:hypothetical protein